MLALMVIWAKAVMCIKMEIIKSKVEAKLHFRNFFKSEEQDDHSFRLLKELAHQIIGWASEQMIKPGWNYTVEDELIK